MKNAVLIAENLYWLGGSDRKLSFFEGLYPVPRGISYNAYLLMDEKTVLFDTVDSAVGDAFLNNLEAALGGRSLDYLIVQHMEPDHSATFLRTVEKYPDVTVVVNKKSAQMLAQYYGFCGERIRTVAENEELCTGKHTLKFIFAPMVHWPEVMFTYDGISGTLFSADAFGTFGALEGSLFSEDYPFEQAYLPEARRYYTNIVGKYGVQVQAALKKTEGLSIERICPLHGPVLRKDAAKMVEKYRLWSGYQPEEKGAAVFYASIYGHTQSAAELLASALAQKGIPVCVYDVSVTDCSELLAQAFRVSHLAFASVTYNGGLFPKMETLINDLKAHGLRGRTYALIENGSWAPAAGKIMAETLSAMKEFTQIGETATLLSAGKQEQEQAILALAEAIANDIKK